jgi:hypothetical protein
VYYISYKFSFPSYQIGIHFFLIDVEHESREISNSPYQKQAAGIGQQYIAPHPAKGHKKQKQCLYNLMDLNQSQTIICKYELQS